MEEEKVEKPEEVNSSKEELKKKIHHGHKGNSLGRILLGLILVFVGLVYFLKTTGLIDIQINIDIWQLWPLIIIFFGLSLISVRGWAATILGIVISLIVLAILFFAIFYKSSPWFQGGGRPIVQKEVSVDRAPKTFSANINIKFGAGTINIKEGPSDKLVSGLFESKSSELDISEQSGAGVQKVLLNINPLRIWGGFYRPRNTLNLELNQEVPTTILLESGASNSDIDLRKIIAENVTIHTGASSLNLKMGNKQKESNIEIESGASSLNIIFPKGSGARLELDSALAKKTLDGIVNVNDRIWESKDYATADKKINLKIKTGLSSLNISWE